MATKGVTILTEAYIRSIATALESGCHRNEAAAAVQVNKNTFHGWRKRGIDDRNEGKTANESIYVKFIEACDMAEAAAQHSMIEKIREAGKDPKHWQANAWILEHRNPEKWSNSQQLIKAMQKEMQVLIEEIAAMREQLKATKNA